MNTVLQAHHFVAIAGRVLDMDANRDAAVAGAYVEIVSGPPEFIRHRNARGPWLGAARRDERVKTASDGVFYFLDLPDGTYEIRVTAAGAQSASATAIVEHGENPFLPTAVDVALRLAPSPDAPASKPAKKQRPGGRKT